MRIDHFLVRAKDVDRMRDFFESAIGLENGPRPDFPFPGYWLYSEGAALVHLAVDSSQASGEDGELNSVCPVDHVAFTGEDYDALMDRLKTSGAEFTERTVPGNAARQVFVLGPEGVKIEMQFPPAVTAGGSE